MNNMRLNVRESGVAVLTLDLPNSKVNLLSSDVMAELDAILGIIAADKRITGLVITSGKADNFVAGADVNEIAAIQKQSAMAAFEATQHGKAILDKLARLPYHTVAAIHGTCLGGGTELALACKFRLATDSPKTRLGLPEVGLGFIPGWGGTVRLPRLVGAQNAMELILQPLRTWDAKKAWRLGLVSEVVPATELLTRAETVALTGKARKSKQPLKARLTRWAMENTPVGRALLKKFATAGILKETKGKYPAPFGALKVVLASLTLPEKKAFELESRTFADLAVGSVSKNLVGFFLTTQEARKSPHDVQPAVEVRTVGVLGCGVMGSGIAQGAANSGYNVVVCDPGKGALERGQKTIKSLFDGLVEKRRLTEKEAATRYGNIRWTASYADMTDCDLVIEAIIEDVKIKQAALAELEKVIKKPFVFATNTSSLSVTELAATAKHPELYGGLHFFNPVHRMPLVEVVEGEKSAEETTVTLFNFASRLGKTVVTTSDSPGFAVNRVLAPYLLETLRLLEAGVPAADIEKAMTSFGMPMGPVALMDEVGLDICSKVIQVMGDAFGNRLSAPRSIAVINEHKLLGKKGGKGFYLYDKQGKRLGLNEEFINSIKGENSSAKSSGEIQDRLVLVMVNESVHCLAEGVVDDPADMDLSMIMGAGFPPFRGGILRYADETGLRVVHDKLANLAKVAGDNYAPAHLIVTKSATGDRFYQE